LHLAKSKVSSVLGSWLYSPGTNNFAGLVHAECMCQMKLGSRIFSPSRMQLQNLVVFAVLENPDAIEEFFETSRLGQVLSRGWHVRLELSRRWGYVSEFDGLAENTGEQDSGAPVVALTLARMKLFQVPRFIQWGRPVQELVRDHPGATLAGAAMRLPNTVATFSVWNNLSEMTNMVQGHSSVPQPQRHIVAMAERESKDFHYEFTTLRFKPLAEFGEWEGRTNIVPTIN
jgi:hypothetical protein